MSMPELSDASALTVIIACIVAAAIAFVVGVAVTILIRRLAARRNLRVGRRPIWRAPFTVLLVVLAIRGVLAGGGHAPRMGRAVPGTFSAWPRSPSSDGCSRWWPSGLNGDCWPAFLKLGSGIAAPATSGRKSSWSRAWSRP